jgi:hypothetical protein
MSRYGVVVYWPDKPEAGEQILLHAVGATVSFEAGLSDSRAVLDTATTAASTYTIKLNGTAKSTLTYAAGTTFGVFTNAAAWTAQPGDKLEIIAPDPADATAEGIAITLMGTLPDQVNLTATLECSASIRATMDHVFLFATLEADASIPVAKLNLGNLFPQTILYADATLPKAYLTDVFSFKTTIGGEGGAELECFLTVEHDPSLFL